MAKTDLFIPGLSNQFVDLRDSIPGDSYNWSWVRPLSQVNYLAIHHTAGPDTQTPDEIASYHINNNGWGGIGYHFLIVKDGTVYYVGDISTARANVANLNEQVLGICLIGNFTGGRVPTPSQIDSAQKLCEFFIFNYPDLNNVTSWDSVKGHKELPGQSTTCPGDNWPVWKAEIIGSGNPPSVPPSVPPSTSSSSPPPSDRGAQITESYRSVLGRDPDMGGLQTYTNGPLTIEQIVMSMVNSNEHREIIRLAKEAPALQSQVKDLQVTLASVNQQLITLQETIQLREQEISDLKTKLNMMPSPSEPVPPQEDHTLTIVGALINLYQFIFPARKES